MDFDKEFLDIYYSNDIKNDVVINMFEKHVEQKCDCKKRGKICFQKEYPIFDIKKFYTDKKYFSEKRAIFNGIYNTCMSISQSLKCSANRKCCSV